MRELGLVDKCEGVWWRSGPGGACLESSMAEWWHKRRVYFRFISRILALRAEAQPHENPIMTMMTADGGTRKKVLRWHTVATPEKGGKGGERVKCRKSATSRHQGRRGQPVLFHYTPLMWQESWRHTIGTDDSAPVKLHTPRALNLSWN